MAAAKIQSAFQLAQQAMEGPDGAFNDKASGPFNTFRTAFRDAANKQPEVLDTVLGVPDMILVLQFLLKVQEKKSIRRAQVKSAIQNLFVSDVWFDTAAGEDALKAALVEFLSSYSDCSDITARLDPPKEGEAEDGSSEEDDGANPLVEEAPPGQSLAPPPLSAADATAAAPMVAEAKVDAAAATDAEANAAEAKPADAAVVVALAAAEAKPADAAAVAASAAAVTPSSASAGYVVSELSSASAAAAAAATKSDQAAASASAAAASAAIKSDQAAAFASAAAASAAIKASQADAASASTALAANLRKQKEPKESAEDRTRRLIEDALAEFRDLNFVYPTGNVSRLAQRSDDALEAFSSNFYTGVSRLAMSIQTFEAKGEDTSLQEGVLKELIQDEEIPKVLDFLVGVWENNRSQKNRVAFCVEKLAAISPRFRALLASGYTLPWPYTPQAKPAPDRPVATNQTWTVVWIDGKRDSFEKASILKDFRTPIGGCIQVKGFHDDWSRGTPSDACELAEDYLIDALVNPTEHVVAIIVNNSPLHKQLVNNILHDCQKRGVTPPFCIACTKAKWPEFVGSGVTFWSSRREVVQAIALDEFITRASGGHKFALGSDVVVFSGSQGCWVQAIVEAINPDGTVVVVYGPAASRSMKQIAPQQFGTYVRAPSKESVWWSLVRS